MIDNIGSKNIFKIILFFQILFLTFEMRNIHSHETDQSKNLFSTNLGRQRDESSPAYLWFHRGVFRSDLPSFQTHSAMRNTKSEIENKKNSIVFQLINSPQGHELLSILAEQLIETESDFIDQDLNRLIIPDDLPKHEKKNIAHSKDLISRFFFKLEKFRDPLKMFYFSHKSELA